LAGDFFAGAFFLAGFFFAGDFFTGAFFLAISFQTFILFVIDKILFLNILFNYIKYKCFDNQLLYSK